MLAIRMQRTGRSGHAMFRMIVQDSRWSPLSGRNVASLGSYDPHTKAAQLDKEKAATFLKNGAQPSDRAARLLKKEGVKLPKWVELEGKRTGKTKNPEKLRKNRPAEAGIPEEPAKSEEAPVSEEPTEDKTEAKADEKSSIKESAPEADAETPESEAESESTDKKE